MTCFAPAFKKTLPANSEWHDETNTTSNLFLLISTRVLRSSSKKLWDLPFPSSSNKMFPLFLYNAASFPKFFWLFSNPWPEKWSAIGQSITVLLKFSKIKLINDYYLLLLHMIYITFHNQDAWELLKCLQSQIASSIA